jgi:hypothetical protein
MFLVTFINVPGHKEIITTVYPPIGILSMSACLKKEGYQTDYIDADVWRLTSSDVSAMVCKKTADVILVHEISTKITVSHREMRLDKQLYRCLARSHEKFERRN